MLFNREIEPTIDYHDNGLVKTIQYFNAGEMSRFDGPAFQSFTVRGVLEYEAWMHGGKYHREDGPAWVHYKTNGGIYSQRFYINGVQHSFRAFLNLMPKKDAKIFSAKYFHKTAWRDSFDKIKSKG